MIDLQMLVRGVGDVAVNMERRRQKTKTAVGDAIVLSAKIVRDAGFDLARTPFRRRGLFRNVQDAPRRFQVRPFDLVSARLNSDRTEAKVLAKAHITTARSDAIKAVLQKTGQGKDLVRKELWVKRGSSNKRNRSHAGHPSRAGLQRVSLAGGLSRFGGSRRRPIREWALPKDLDKRDTVRIKGDALRIIILRPALERNRQKVVYLIRTGVKRGMK